ncbi:MAG: hypothetical protein AMJ94_07560 [Deltaproteobacteria bacterium SM23_61]|nr:MAG: hypothetical protein AMJ94_07560 [Deltaproteobacteria bacterium SM23_61]
MRRWGGLFLLPILFVFFLNACEEEESASPGPPEKHSRVYTLNEKYIIRGVANLLKEKGYADPKVDTEKGTVETDYIPAGNVRTKVVVTVKKLNQREREVTLLITTEKKVKEGWKAIKILEKPQYDKFFDEIEMQTYRELAKGY